MITAIVLRKCFILLKYSYYYYYYYYYCHLGSAIGSRLFVENFAEEKVSKWKKKLEHPFDNTMTRPQAAYTAFIHGMKSKWIYLERTTPNIDHQLAPMEEVMRGKFLPAITGQSVFDDNLRNLMGLLMEKLSEHY